MDKTGENIIEKENQQRNIERLAAQKEMYFYAKRLFFVQFIVTVVITIALALAALALSAFGSTTDLNWVRGSYGVIAALVDLFILNHFINQLRQEPPLSKNYSTAIFLAWNGIRSVAVNNPDQRKSRSTLTNISEELRAMTSCKHGTPKQSGR